MRDFEKVEAVSHFWVGGKLIRNLDLDKVVGWAHPLEFKIVTEIEEFKLTTRMKGGQLRK